MFDAEEYFFDVTLPQVLLHLKTHQDAKFVRCESSAMSHPPHFLLHIATNYSYDMPIAMFVGYDVDLAALVAYARDKLPRLVPTHTQIPAPVQQTMDEEEELVTSHQ